MVNASRRRSGGDSRGWRWTDPTPAAAVYVLGVCCSFPFLKNRTWHVDIVRTARHRPPLPSSHCSVDCINERKVSLVRDEARWPRIRNHIRTTSMILWQCGTREHIGRLRNNFIVLLQHYYLIKETKMVIIFN